VLLRRRKVRELLSGCFQFMNHLSFRNFARWTVILFACSGVARATPLYVTGSSGSLEASAFFDNSGGNLVVTLTNLSTSDVLAPSEVLTGVFFKVNNDPALTRISAILASGSSVYGGGVSSGNSVGGEWAYLNGLNIYGANQGISSSGLGLFGSANRFPPGENLQNTNSPGGVEYGITSLGDNLLTGNGGISGQALIKNSVVFTLGGFKDLDPIRTISNVTFQYGTSLKEPHVAVPDGGSTILYLGLALIAFSLAAPQLARTKASR
jgi:hypothetical protein